MRALLDCPTADAIARSWTKTLPPRDDSSSSNATRYGSDARAGGSKQFGRLNLVFSNACLRTKGPTHHRMALLFCASYTHLESCAWRRKKKGSLLIGLPGGSAQTATPDLFWPPIRLNGCETVTS